jgi:hypothetical protein
MPARAMEWPRSAQETLSNSFMLASSAFPEHDDV